MMILRTLTYMLLLLLPFSASLTLSRKARSVPRTLSCYLHYRCSSHLQTNCYRHGHLIVSHHLHFIPGSLPDFHIIGNIPSAPAVQANKTETSELFWTLPLLTHPFPHTCTIHYQFPSTLPPKHLSDPPLSPHLHYYCLSLPSFLSLLDFYKSLLTDLLASTIHLPSTSYCIPPWWGGVKESKYGHVLFIMNLSSHFTSHRIWGKLKYL